MELEHMDLISDTDLGFLEDIIEPVCPVLLEKIHQFKAQNCKLPKIMQLFSLIYLQSLN